MSEPLDRAELARRFDALLDRALDSEEAPAGIDAEILAAVNNGGAPQSEYGLYALWSAMTALAQEVKLEGRAFKELNETLGTQPSRIADELRAVYESREREVQREAERRARKEILGALIDLRDRLMRGLESARPAVRIVPRPDPNWYERLGRRMGLLEATPETPAVVAAIVKGYELGLERLDDTLADFNAREILCQGRPFDPRRMNAIEREESTSAPDGTVLEVYRSGFEWNGEVFRPAQVKVACAPATEKQNE